jgi:hypothetical protein
VISVPPVSSAVPLGWPIPLPPSTLWTLTVKRCPFEASCDFLGPNYAFSHPSLNGGENCTFFLTSTYCPALFFSNVCFLIPFFFLAFPVLLTPLAFVLVSGFRWGRNEHTPNNGSHTVVIWQIHLSTNHNTKKGGRAFQTWRSRFVFRQLVWVTRTHVKNVVT